MVWQSLQVNQFKLSYILVIVLSMRQLASIQKVIDIQPIDGADAIECIQVLGWQLVAKKGEFKVGDLCVYCEVDSVLPERPEFEFLRAKKFRIKTIRLKGQISQGIAFPLDVLKQVPRFASSDPVNGLQFGKDTSGVPTAYFHVDYSPEEIEQFGWSSDYDSVALVEGTDVTAILGVTKWEPKEEDEELMVNGQPVRSKKKGEFPDWISKTDETRIQSVPQVLADCVGSVLYRAEKLDGSSMTVYLKLDKDTGEFKFGVCSRNQEKLEDEFCHFWATARKLELEERLRNVITEVYPLIKEGKMFKGGVALQGELVGPGVQKNRLKLPEHDFYVFNVMDIDSGEFLGFDEFKSFCIITGLKTVPILDDNFVVDENTTVDSLVTLATHKSVLCPTAWAEGDVFRTKTESRHRKLGRFSFKAINPEFLIVHKI